MVFTGNTSQTNSRLWNPVWQGYAYAYASIEKKIARARVSKLGPNNLNCTFPLLKKDTGRPLKAVKKEAQ